MHRRKPLKARSRLARRGIATPRHRRGKRRAKSLRMRLKAEFSRLIRKRDRTCQLVGFFAGACGGSLQASHIYPTGAYPLLALFPLNAVSACYKHHLHGWHKSPLDAARWIDTYGYRAELEHAKTLIQGRKGMTEAEIRAEWKAYNLC